MKHKTKKFIYNIVVILLLITGISWVFSRFIHLGRVEYTDNAQIRQLIVPVNSRVQGFIDKICFDEYRPVRKGDTLALIEDTEFRFRVAQAEADYQNALSGKSAMTTTINTTQNNLAVSDAGLEEARIRMDNAQREYQRYKNLYEKAAVTHQQYDAVKTDYEALKARYELLSRQKQSTALIKQEQTQRLEQNMAGIKLAKSCSGTGQVKPFVHRDYRPLRRYYRPEKYPGRPVDPTRANTCRYRRRQRHLDCRQL